MSYELWRLRRASLASEAEAEGLRGELRRIKARNAVLEAERQGTKTATAATREIEAEEDRAVAATAFRRGLELFAIQTGRRATLAEMDEIAKDALRKSTMRP